MCFSIQCIQKPSLLDASFHQQTKVLYSCHQWISICNSTYSCTPRLFYQSKLLSFANVNEVKKQQNKEIFGKPQDLCAIILGIRAIFHVKLQVIIYMGVFNVEDIKRSDVANGAMSVNIISDKNKKEK